MHCDLSRSWLRFSRSAFSVVVAIAAGLIVAADIRAQEAFTVQAVARDGDPAPVAPVLVRASTPALNNRGQIAFLGDGGLLLASEGALHVVAAPGDPAPDGGRFTLISSPSLNDAGELAFVASVTAPGRSGVYVYSGGTIHAVALTDDPAPGGGTFTFVNLPAAPSINGLGEIAFAAFIDTAGTRRIGIYLYSGGALTNIIQEPSAPFAFGSSFVASVQINDGRHVLFRVSGVGAPPLSSRIFVLTPEPRMLRQIAPQFSRTPDGGTFLNVAQEPSINSVGQVAFWAEFMAPNGQPTSGLFVQSGNTLQEIARRDSRIPDGAGNETIRTFSRPSLNATGEVAFQVTYGDGLHAMLLWSGGVITRLTTSGESLPSASLLRSATAPSLNALGQVAFIGTTGDSLDTVYLISEQVLSKVAGTGDGVTTTPRYFSVFASNFLVPAGARSTLFLGRTFPGGIALFQQNQRLIGEGDRAPGGGVISSVSLAAASNQRSDVAVIGALSTGETALFLVSDTGARELIRTGTALSDGTTFTTLASGSVSMNVHGDVVFNGTTSAGRTGIYLLQQGVAVPIARVGDPAPAGGLITSLSGPPPHFSVNDGGQVAFIAVTDRAGALERCTCLWQSGQSLSLAQSGLTASVSNAGEVASSNSTDVVLSTLDKTVVVARSGDAAPGGGVFGVPFGVLGGPVISFDGQLSFLMSDPQFNSAMFAFVDGVTEFVAKGGDAPRQDGFTFRSLGAPRATSRTEIVFTASTSDLLSGVYTATRRPTAPRLRIETPNDPSDWGIGTRQVIGWTYSGTATHLDVEISRDGGASWEVLRRVPNRGASQNARISVPGPATSTGRVRVTAVGDVIGTDTNDSDIRISDAYIDVILPVEGESIRRGADSQIFIAHNLGARVPVAVDVSADGGHTWRTNVTRARTRGATTSVIAWMADMRPTTAARVRLRALDGSGAIGISSMFKIRRVSAREAADTMPSAPD